MTLTPEQEAAQRAFAAAAGLPVKRALTPEQIRQRDQQRERTQAKLIKATGLDKEGKEAMADYRSMFDRDYIGSWDLLGKDVTVTIAKVEAATLTAQGGRKSKKPVVHFEGRERGLALNKTNARTIAAMYGNETSKWVGKRITIFPTTTSMGSDTVECIRVRPSVPGPKRVETTAKQRTLEPGQRECPECDGSNEACARCFGAGVISA